MHRVTDRDGTAAPHGSDFLQLRADDVPADGKADWLARQVRQAITDRRLTVGSRLPATRLLAAELRVSRGVVTEAYRRLAEDGQVEGADAAARWWSRRPRRRCRPAPNSRCP